MLGAGALGRPRGMVWGGRREKGSGWGTNDSHLFYKQICNLDSICLGMLFVWASLVAQLVKNPLAMQETWVQSLGWEDSPGEGKGYSLQ